MLDMNGSGCELAGPVWVLTSYACFDVTFPSVEGAYTVNLVFSDDIGDPAISSVAVRDGATSVPCEYNLTLEVYSTTSYSPTPSYCLLTPQTPIGCPDGGGAGAEPPASPGTEPGDEQCPCFDGDGDGIPEVDCDEDDVADVDPITGELLTAFGWDTDGDGFSDGQECLPSGVPGLNGASLNIAELGADPLVPDIFVEIDRMAPDAGHDHVPPPSALDAIRDMFRNADVFQGGGIAIHLDAGPNSVMHVDPVTGAEIQWGTLSEANEIPHEDIAIGAADDVAIRDFTIDTEATHFNTNARGRVFHYCLSAHYGAQNQVHGKAEAGQTGGDTFAVTTQSQSPSEVADNYARIFVHELGHCLGLFHAPFFVPGDRNGFPYYHSIMENTGGYPATCATSCAGGIEGVRVMDYSGEELGPFDETAVDEATGLCVIDGVCIGGNCQPFNFNGQLTNCPEMPYGMDLDKDGFADNQNVVGRNDWKSLFHHNNSRAERLLETAISSGVWAECDDVIQ